MSKPMSKRLPRYGNRIHSLEPGSEEWLWAMLCDEVPETLVEDNPFIDHIFYDRSNAICQRLILNEAEVVEPPKRQNIGWEEYQRRQRAGKMINGRKRYRKKKLMAAVAQALSDGGFSLLGAP